MSDNIQKFGDIAQAVMAFKITAKALIDQKEAAVSEDNPDGDTQYNVLRDISATIPFSSTASTYGDMIETVPSPLAERLATLAVHEAERFNHEGEQILNQLYLADISARVPHFGNELLDAEKARALAKNQLDLYWPAQTVKIHDQVSGVISGLSPDSKDILVQNAYRAVDMLSSAEHASPLVAERLHDFLLTHVSAEQVGPKYNAATAILFNLTTSEGQRTILNEKIDAMLSAADPGDVLAHDPVLAKFGKAPEDFQHEDGTAKGADLFVRLPVSGPVAEPRQK